MTKTYWVGLYWAAQLVILTYLLFTFSASDVTTGEFDRDVTSPLEHEQHLKVLIQRGKWRLLVSGNRRPESKITTLRTPCLKFLATPLSR